MNVLYPEMIYPEIMTYPSITDGAIDFLNKNILNKNLIGLEFGIGTSTIYMAKKFKKFVGIEHNGIYFYNIVTQLSPYDKEKITLILHHSEIDEKTDKLIDSYADELDQFEDEYFDFILWTEEIE